jgi:hypothetical protein
MVEVSVMGIPSRIAARQADRAKKRLRLLATVTRSLPEVRQADADASQPPLDSPAS